jgi:F-type H+-transporting ATPase subunit a
MKLLTLSSLLFLLSENAEASEGAYNWLSFLLPITHLPLHTLTLILVGLILTIAGFLYRSSLGKVDNLIIPDKGITIRNLFELYGKFIMGQCKAVIGEHEGPKYFRCIATIFLVIFLSNLIGLVPGFAPPTGNMSTTFALGIFSFVYYNIKGCKELGTINYLKHFAGPLWYLAILIFPIEILSNFIRPLSLALRLKNNMMADHTVVAVFLDMAPFLVPVIFMLMGVLVSFIQAYVFTVLSMVYINLATAHHDHEGQEAH